VCVQYFKICLHIFSTGGVLIGEKAALHFKWGYIFRPIYARNRPECETLNQRVAQLNETPLSLWFASVHTHTTHVSSVPEWEPFSHKSATFYCDVIMWDDVLRSRPKKMSCHLAATISYVLKQKDMHRTKGRWNNRTLALRAQQLLVTRQADKN
jgi:hypothetical protein